MITGADVLAMLCPNQEWVIYGNDYDSIQWITGESITKEQFDAGFLQVEAYKAKLNDAAIEAREIAEKKLASIGLTLNDLKALGLA